MKCKDTQKLEFKAVKVEKQLIKVPVNKKGLPEKTDNPIINL